MNREEAIQAVCDELDPIIAQLEADETDLMSRLEMKRQRLVDKRDSKARRIERIEQYYDAKAIVDNPPSEVKSGG